ncbi:MAG: di-trans,poly-cis-decaprenylcistransferase [Spirochaetia bacterium]|nr:di-trans,poly-cis-decaprenylcistransferase [Spirochaetia bacterium]MBR4796579.1 di-trans,poly-cis-decaprenylcistransferase [Spirochaetia bacterium]MBR5016814.1 di-trans,poly-cis-decaprenylcistransferase [Spirochaetia bacterium]MBR5916154.1 di-trans,poly-cis-decaprenylcistransferase [Spirochaetia bacterium]
MHIGIIMDGNGRWAKERGKPRTFGHSEGVRTAKRIAKAASDMGIEYLSLYTFSTENWKRSEKEVKFLMQLLRKHLREQLSFYRENNIRVVHSGSLDRLPKVVQKEIVDVEALTKDFTGMTANLVINYGGRDEIVRAVKKLRDRGESEITEETLSAAMDHPDIPDPDLIIRTGGELRISNFLLWESAYSELYFSKKYWPDWQAEDLKEAVDAYASRSRRYGGVTETK